MIAGKATMGSKPFCILKFLKFCILISDRLIRKASRKICTLNLKGEII